MWLCLLDCGQIVFQPLVLFEAIFFPGFNCMYEVGMKDFFKNLSSNFDTNQASAMKCFVYLFLSLCEMVLSLGIY